MAENKTFSLKVRAAVDELQNVLSFVEECAEGIDCPYKTQMQINLAVEEIFVNIANYAYADKNGEADIRVETSDEPRSVTIAFADSGVRYNPLAKPDPDVTLSAREREIGGLGIFLTKKFMDEVSYEYRDGQNVFTMKKLL